MESNIGTLSIALVENISGAFFFQPDLRNRLIMLYRLLIPTHKISVRWSSAWFEKIRLIKKSQLYTGNVLGIWELYNWILWLYVLGFHELVKEAEVYKAIMAQESIYNKADINNVYGRVCIHHLSWPIVENIRHMFYYFKFIY